MNQNVNAIANRLSLRQPQRDSLEILARVCEIIELEKNADPAKALATVQSEFPTVTDFDRDFPSLCFALATGVGKTRLMGAFISYLFKAEGVRHFFVLAPNLTIYSKLIADFTVGSPKYVFQGIADFVTKPPEIITSDNYESGRGVRGKTLFEDDGVHINIFNVSKITSIETPKGAAKTNVPRFRRFRECIGESYFEYLAKLDDLVLLMDESHRYRASAGIKAINELRPILGLELTATPQVEKGNAADPFKNVIFSYPLCKALDDGFVKEPAVATRENFNVGNYDDDALERLKLEDGILVHEETKLQLDVYARENGQRRVKPFMLIVAKDTDHANALLQTIEKEDFFEGRYKGRTITVHSNLKGEEKEETVQQLLYVEDPDNPTEIVIHVNMLKEGWDVTNLYTIVPLRAANSRTLVEQSIGRGLRLPFGKRTNNAAVDRLTIVSHDRFQEIIDEANRPDSIIRTGVIIGKDIPDKKSQLVIVESKIEEHITGKSGGDKSEQKNLFEKPAEQKAAQVALEVIKQYERLPRSTDLKTPEIQKEMIEKVAAAIKPLQPALPGMAEEVDVAKIVQKTTDLFIDMSIDIPKIVVLPSGDVKCGFQDFDMDTKNIRLQPVDEAILIQQLHDHERYRLRTGEVVAESRLEDYLVRGLIDFDDIDYTEHSTLIYKLAGQVVQHLQSYLKNEQDVLNVLQAHNQNLVRAIHTQMEEHYKEEATAYEAKITKGFRTMRPNNFTAPADEPVRNFRNPVDEKKLIRGMLFGGFKKCLYRLQKFDSDTERRFSVILENDGDVMKWVKPAKTDFQINYSNDDNYEPDFVVETSKTKYLCEPKAEGEMNDPIVTAKAEAARIWCKHATAHGGKPWVYLLIPQGAVDETKTLAGLAATFGSGK